VWRDAHGISGENNYNDVLRAHKPAVYISAGILFKSDEAGVTIFTDYGVVLDEGDENTYRTRTFIPRVLIDDEFDRGPLTRGIRKKKVKVDPIVSIPEGPVEQ